MSEIEKMYENAGIEIIEGPEWICKNPDHCTYQNLSIVPENCSGCEFFEREMIHPPFTAEKQIAIFKLISKQGQVIIENWEKDNRGFNVTFRANSNLRYITMDSITRKTAEEALAQIVNDIWQDLTSEEKQQIKEILE